MGKYPVKHPTKYNWNDVDWQMRNADIARALGYSSERVRQQRIKVSPDTVGRRRNSYREAVSEKFAFRELEGQGVLRVFAFSELEDLARRMFVPHGCPVRRSRIDLDAETVTVVYGGGEYSVLRRTVPFRAIIAYYKAMHGKRQVVE